MKQIKSSSNRNKKDKIKIKFKGNKKNEKDIIKKYIDDEINDLSYEFALLYDRRTFFQ